MALLGSCDSETYFLRSKLDTLTVNVHTSRRYRRRNICSWSTTPSLAESRSAAVTSRNDSARRSRISLTKNSSVWSVISCRSARFSIQLTASL